MNKYFICFSFLTASVLSSPAYAQNFTSPDKSISIGVNIGMISPVSPFGGRYDYPKWSPSIGYGLYGKKQLLRNVFVRADFMGGKFSGSDNPAVAANSYFSYQTNLNYALSASAGVNTDKFPVLQKRYSLRLSAHAGWGLSGYRVSTFNSSGVTTGVGKYNRMFIPLGLGAELSVTDQINIDLGCTLALVDHDGLDGRYGGTNDRFNYLHAGVGYFFGQGKQRAGYKTEEKQYDQLVAAIRDSTALKMGQLERKIETLTQQNQHLEAQIKDWFVDSDGDGVVDQLDKCPGTAKNATVDGAGCPVKLPETPAVKFQVSDEDRANVRQALRNVYFEPESPNILSRSLVHLNNIVNLLEEKGFGIKLSVFTDNRGNAKANLNLTKQRAETLKAYLLSVGGDARRIQVDGYGGTKPIASNRTYKGRLKNNRIEFSLY